MSRDAVARMYVRILNDNNQRRIDCTTHEIFDDTELTPGEVQLLREEAGARAFASDEGPVMSYLRGAPALSPRLASELGIALNRAHGLPTASLQELGYRSTGPCCPWGHPKIPDPRGMLE